ncbi:MAG: hypothetical protein ED556_04725 [Winogradskyella sp.]|uniref:hypothetical protein n=1 Tax=Winogradskyella sp. TaxID=1883156 RepID=UPI000F40BD4F|nr:hypothetical protein [Winogradskyella sp.]RNC86728.1 MAG: hypothetical protein ED556_04725 [Winogradskyella sp.]
MKYVLITLLLTFSLSFSNAQQKVEADNSQTNRVSEIFNYTKSTSNYLLLNQVEANPFRQNGTRNPSTNLTTIEQIGNQNIANSSTSSNTSMIELVQVGNNNTFQSTNTLLDVNERIIQNGNNNSITNFSFGNIKSSSLNILQNGNNLSVEKFGTNSLTEKLSLRVVGNNQTVIIRSF